MKKLFMLLFILLSVLSGCGGGSDGGNNTYYVTVTIQAIDEITGLAVTGAVTIIENGSVGINGGEGITTFTNILGNKDYTFVTTANTYNINRKTVHIGPSNTTVTVSLNKLVGSITGSVVDEAEAPISGDIRLVELNKTTVSDPITGEFMFENVPVVDDPYSISITKTGYNERVIDNLKLSASNLIVSAGKITLGNTPGVLTGRVTDSYSRIITNVEVRIPETNQSAFTDSNGDYTLQIFPGSNYTAEFTHADYSPFVKTGIQIRPNQTTVLNASLPVKGGSIFGVIRNSLNEPVPGALITVIGTSASGLSAIDGTFRINDVQPGTYTVTITHDLYNSTSVNAVVNSNQETSVGNITLANKTGTIKGYLSEPNCTVTLIQTKESQAYINPGYFQFNNVQPGTYVVKIERPGDYQSKMIHVTVGSSETKDLENISMIAFQTGAPFGPETQNGTASATGPPKIVSFTVPYQQNVNFDWSVDYHYYDPGPDDATEMGDNQVYIKNASNQVIFSKDGRIVYNQSGTHTLNIAPGVTYKIQNTEDNYVGSSSIVARWLIDIKYPKINFNLTWSSGQSSYNITINVAEVNLTSVQYIITSSSSTPPAEAEWTTIANDSSIVINTPGVNYIHVRAYDVMNQMGYRCEGPFIVK